MKYEGCLGWLYKLREDHHKRLDLYEEGLIKRNNANRCIVSCIAGRNAVEKMYKEAEERKIIEDKTKRESYFNVIIPGGPSVQIMA
jgi:hypothetical protein